jgi:osmotically inducible protein OsmC
MPELLRYGSGTWNGDLQSGNGSASTESGVLQNAPVTFVTRFSDPHPVNGSNPEELLGAAHAACFSMALSATLSKDGHVPTSINTTATVKLVKGASGFKIVGIHITTEGDVPGIDQETFLKAAETAKDSCPVSALLKPGLEELTLDAKLVS